jgi:hypothetical protein
MKYTLSKGTGAGVLQQEDNPLTRSGGSASNVRLPCTIRPLLFFSPKKSSAVDAFRRVRSNCELQTELELVEGKIGK